MPTIKLTSKRQATFPAKLLEELGIGPGDEIEVTRKTVKGDIFWLLTPKKVDISWFGSLRTSVKKHISDEEIRRQLGEVIGKSRS